MATIKDDTTSNTKDERIYIRLASELKEDFAALAAYKGLKSATLLHSLIVKTIHEAREERPQIFANRQRNDDHKVERGQPDQLEKVSVKSPRGISGKAKSLLISDGKSIPLIDEAASADEDGQ